MANYEITLIATLFLMIIFTRGLPFFFAKSLQQNVKFQAVGKQLPAYIMLLLVIYEINPKTFLQTPHGLPELIALGILTITHYLFRQMLLSIAIGTVSYVALLHFLISK